ncbi:MULTISPECIES: acyl-CoA dehydrogenase family protein [unclassified Sphingopyxis]|uniref:acyl-CoA dehydrogenase family protein n=1 Tax=unclassified Sphingopyxis TaxID=2614943 RepID=UPI000737030A|nr:MULTISPECIES: acyl-CoA dehydrogenase family protein [unclassified Sphingopyxis]KTE38081.1 acyl-CoA dehydrogenase [Sphingopyxis sp. HIX]KTE84610.1 acyl-CoA dehydrogenase [Sphingopyxis sp. HXXIV]
MDIAWSADEIAFRDEVRAFLANELTDELRASGAHMTSVYADPRHARAWQAILHEKGWVAPSWPVEHGGTGWSLAQRYIWQRERIAAGAPPVSPMGVQMCGPAIIGHGSAEQKAFFLPRMLSGEHFWCQGYSETGSGSDLASLQCRAEEDGDDLVVTGQKLWSTHAHAANWGFFLVRTATLDRPQKGITFLLIDMTSPGVTVVPTVSPAGENIQNEIFLDAVRVPKANVVGAIGDGWTVAKYLLDFERGGAAYAPGLQIDLDEIEQFASEVRGDDGGRLIDDAAFADAIAQARIDVMALEIFEFRAMSDAGAGRYPAAIPSLMKIRGTELQQRITELRLLAAGRYGLAYQPQAGVSAGPVHFPHGEGDFVGPREAAIAPMRYVSERAASIYAGTNEIQRNIIAKIMGL